MDKTPSTFKPRSKNWKKRVEASFAEQHAMETLGVTIAGMEPGKLRLELDFAKKLTQQHGFIHAGIITTVMDSACGYAAFTLMDEDAEVLTVEFKANFMAPAAGKRFIIEGEVIKSGKTISVCEGRAFALSEDNELKLFANLSATMMAVRNIPTVNKG